MTNCENNIRTGSIDSRNRGDPWRNRSDARMVNNMRAEAFIFLIFVVLKTRTSNKRRFLV